MLTAWWRGGGIISGSGVQFRFLGNCAPTPTPKSTLTLTSHLEQNVGLGEGLVGSFPET